MKKKPVAVQPKNNETKVDTLEKVYQIVERMPSFPGGDEALLKFVFDNMKYPEEAKDKGIQGRVHVHFTVGKDGSITDVEIYKGVHPLLDAEAIRVIKSMPKWIPGMKRDEPVSVRYTFPVMFRTEGPKAKKW